MKRIEEQIQALENLKFPLPTPIYSCKTEVSLQTALEAMGDSFIKAYKEGYKIGTKKIR